MRLADLEHEMHGCALYAKITGEIDMSNAAELRTAISAVTPNDALGVILDLSALDYMDSAGVHLVYRLRDDLKRRGQALRLVIPEAAIVNDALRLAGIERGTEVVETVAEAERALEPENGTSCRG